MTKLTSPWRHFVTFGAMALLAGCVQPSPMQADTSIPISNPPPTAPGSAATWYHVAFATGSFALDADGQKTIAAVTDFLRRNPNAIATLIGKADTVGTAQYNMHLSHQRADAVRDALVYGGKIEAWRVETRWTGETGQAVATEDDTARAANRVVDIAIH